MASGFAASLVPFGHDAELFCRASVSSRCLSQPWSNLPLYLSIHSFGRVVRGVRRAGGEVHEERPVRRQRLLGTAPADRLVRHVGREVVVRVVRHLDAAHVRRR